MFRNKTFFFIHQNFPGQFLHLCRALSAENRVFFITKTTANRLSNVTLVQYTPHRAVSKEIHPYLRLTEDAVLNGQGAARALLRLQRDGVSPDIIIGHSGWGETLFAKDIFPDVPLLSYFEFYYSAIGADVGFDPEFPSNEETKFRLRCRNQTVLSCLEATDAGISPTRWQHSRLPECFGSKVSVIHDGVDTVALAPANNPSVTLNGMTFDGSVPVVTFVARNLEPYRGFHVFMRAAEKILQRDSRLHIVIVGADDVSYGARLANGEAYRARALREVDVDSARIHFVGRVEYDVFKRLLQVSDAHVYLTYPFVLSWSMLEAMSSGCLVIGSRTAPVEEVIEHEKNGLLVDFHDAEEIASTVIAAVREPARFREIRAAARRTIQQEYDFRTTTLPRQAALIKRIIA